jgi:D-hexose-6-phosphate mutarotase
MGFTPHLVRVTAETSTLHNTSQLRYRKSTNHNAVLGGIPLACDYFGSEQSKQ